jgi:hypothetical protein
LATEPMLPILYQLQTIYMILVFFPISKIADLIFESVDEFK